MWQYAIQVWYPRLTKHQTVIEKVQRRATSFITKLRGLPYEERLRRLNMPSLEYRRRRGRMIEVYKCIRGGYDSRVCKLFNINDRDTRGNNTELKTGKTRHEVRKLSVQSTTGTAILKKLLKVKTWTYSRGTQY